MTAQIIPFKNMPGRSSPANGDRPLLARQASLGKPPRLLWADHLTYAASLNALAVESAAEHAAVLDHNHPPGRARSPLPGRASRMQKLGAHASGVTHDFRNILSIVCGQADLALFMLPEDHPAREHLEIVQQAARQGSELSDAILAFSRGPTAKRSPLDLASLVAESAGLIEAMAGDAITVDTRLGAGEHTWILGDAAQLRRILLNLAENAVDAMPAGGRMTLSLRRRRSSGRKSVELAITDTGVGMSAIVRARLFEPFFSTKDTMQRTGLGMCLVQDSVDQHGGRLDVHTVPGGGTTIAITLPTIRRPRRNRSTAPPRDILLIEGNSQVRRILTSGLRRAGFCVTVVDDVRQATKAMAAADQPVRAAVIDMDEQPSPVDLNSVRASAALRGLVILTSTPASRPDALSPGDQILAKPFGIDALTASIGRVLDSSEDGC